MNKEKPWLTMYPLKNNEIKAYLKLANITIGINKKMNCFQKLMYKLFFGIEIEKVESKDEK